MPLQVGTTIKSTSVLNGDYFESSIAVLTECNDNGAVGFVTNKPFARKLNELEEFKYLPNFPLFEGGPVDQEHLFFIHKRPDLIENSTRINNGIYYGGDFNQAVNSICNKAINTSEIKIFIGYCGWDTLELEAEINEGSWEIAEEMEDIF